MKKCIVVGSANMDIVVRVPHIPVVGETILAKGVRCFPGGKGANQAAAIAKLGGNIQMIGCVGADGYGDRLISDLAGYGVDTSGIAQLPDIPTGNAYINVSDAGENNIVVNPGANGLVTPELLTENDKAFADAAYCIVQLETPLDTLYALAALCKEQGIPLIVNPAPAAQLDFDRLAGCFMIAPNESELDLLVAGEDSIEAKAKALYAKGFANVLVTLGSQGCLLVDSQGCRYFPVHQGLPVQDTTAAGDSFIGALVYGLCKDLELTQAIAFATKAAAITVSRMGAQPSLPSLAEVEAL